MFIGPFFLVIVQCIKQIDSILPWVFSVIDHRRRHWAVKTLNTLLPSTVNEDCSDLLGSTYQQQLEYRLAPHELSAPTPPIAVLSSPFLFALTSFPAELSSPPLHEPTCNENAVEINR